MDENVCIHKSGHTLETKYECMILQEWRWRITGNNSNINSSNITNMWNEIPSNKTEPVFAIDILFYILNQRKLTSKTCIEHFERYAKIQINYYLRWNKIATKKIWTGFEYYLKLSSCATKPFADSAHAHSALNS